MIRKNEPINQSINQSIEQSKNQSINQTINQSISQSIDQSINQSTERPINQPINQSIDQMNTMDTMNKNFKDGLTGMKRKMEENQGKMEKHSTGCPCCISYATYLIVNHWYVALRWKTDSGDGTNKFSQIVANFLLRIARERPEHCVDQRLLHVLLQLFIGHREIGMQTVVAVDFAHRLIDHGQQRVQRTNPREIHNVLLVRDEIETPHHQTVRGQVGTQNTHDIALYLKKTQATS